MNKYHLKIIDTFKPFEILSYQDIFKRLKLNAWGSTSTKYYRAFQDLITIGKLDNVTNNKYRLNN